SSCRSRTCPRPPRSTPFPYTTLFRSINAIPILREKSHLPVVADPSHGIGIREHVEPVALAAVIAGADGIIYETHQSPESAASDGQQTLNFGESARLIEKARKVLALRQHF